MCAAQADQNAYIRNLQTLQHIRNVCEGDLNLQQICVVGDQSSGKSSLLSFMTGIAFPVKSGICTKAPIVIECRNDKIVQAPTFEIQDPGTKTYRQVKGDTLVSEIDNIQQKAILKLLEGNDASKADKPKISNEEVRVWCADLST